MEAPSTQGHRGRVPWQGLLLAVFLCIFWVPTTNGGLIFESELKKGIWFPSATLKLQKVPWFVANYTWFKGDTGIKDNEIGTHIVKTGITIKGRACTSRHIIFPKGKMMIQNVTSKDAGYYTLVATKADNKKINVSAHLFFLDHLTSARFEENKATVPGNNNVGIMCLTPEPKYTISWVYNDRELKPEKSMRLSKDHAILSMEHIKKENAGKYYCRFKNTRTSGISKSLTFQVV